MGKASVEFKKEICKLMYKKFKINVRAIYKSCKVGDFFTLKSKTPFFLSANVVYQFKCSRDESTSYIGKTERHLAVRMGEHLAPKGVNSDSTVGKHILKCTTCQRDASFNNFTILHKCLSSQALSYFETIYIRQHHPNLNIQLLNNGGSVLNLF